MTPAQVRQEYEMEFFQGENPVFDAVSLSKVYKPLSHQGGTAALLREWRRLNAISGGYGFELTLDEFDAEREKIINTIEASTHFYTGVDSSEGKAQDQNSICTFNEFGIQVACDHNNMTLPLWAGYTDTDGLEHAGFVSLWHVKYPGDLVIEENGPGLTVYNRYLASGTTDRVRVKRSFDNVAHTGSKTRIINDLVLAVAGKNITITDATTYEQMLAFQRDEATGKMSAPKGKLDDAVMSLAWAYHALKLDGIRGWSATVRRTHVWECVRDT
jgi:hypothetical protein